MGWLQDLLKEVPLSSVLKERVALAEEQYEREPRKLSDTNSGLPHSNARKRILFVAHKFRLSLRAEWGMTQSVSLCICLGPMT
jgi:hypothetical protein